MKPYLALPITSVCNFRCPYCDEGGHGEAIGSSEPYMSLDYMNEVVEAAYRLGARRFRITGGEPFLDKRLGKMVRMICAYDDIQLTVDTNGSKIQDYDEILSSPPPNFLIVMSLDTLRTAKISVMTGGRGKMTSILDNAVFLSRKKLLKRFNTVITVHNADEVSDLISLCKEIEVDLKLSDVARRLSQAKMHNDLYFDVSELYKNLLSQADETFEHSYSSHFGSPMKVCKFGGVKVTLKSVNAGACYSFDEACSRCNHYPCDEGMYFVSALADRKFTACQLNGFVLERGGSTEQSLAKMFDVVGRAKYRNASLMIK